MTASVRSRPPGPPAVPGVLPLLIEEQNLKRKLARLGEAGSSKMSKVEVADEITEESTNSSHSNYKTRKPNPISSKDPLPGLEQFIQNLLKNPKSNPKIVSWVNVDEGIFKIKNLEAFYKVWREMKNVPITYELLKKSVKLSEKSEILLKIPKTFCVFKFGKNAKDWKPKEEETVAESQSGLIDLL